MMRRSASTTSTATAVPSPAARTGHRLDSERIYNRFVFTRRGSVDQWLPPAMILGAMLLLGLGVLAGVNRDEDELTTSVLMTILQMQPLRHGAWPLWTSQVGF